MRSTGIFAAFAVLAMMFLLCSCGPDRSNKIIMVTERRFRLTNSAKAAGSSELISISCRLSRRRSEKSWSLRI
ncbi:MAG: hypothetical protein V8T87_02930 [Victivallales bacterium]